MPKPSVNTHLRSLAAAGGSDLHLRAGTKPRIRVDGMLEPVAGSRRVSAASTRSMAEAIVPEHLQDRFAGGEEVDFAYEVDGIGRFRVNAYLQRDTVALVFRRVVSDPQGIDELRLPSMVTKFAEEARGLVLIAGPTGSGKTTTLAAMTAHINATRRCHIVTIEDPIEVIHRDQEASVSQRELGTDTQSFAHAMRAALREDPDVIVVGEMRDAETVRTALLAAETGHLVLSTMHTNDATETMMRVIEFFPESEQRQARLILAGVLKGTICQRLAPLANGDGRVPVTEVMVVNGRVQNWLLNPDTRDAVQEIIAQGEYYGMHTFDQSVLEFFTAGVIDLGAALANSTNRHDLTVSLRRRGLLKGAVADALGDGTHLESADRDGQQVEEVADADGFESLMAKLQQGH
ncbi:MAG: type IV pilus twitching motility protein PilT [Acidimicrobiales bacterium]